MVWKKRMLRFQNFVSKISFDEVDQISLEHMKGNQNEIHCHPVQCRRDLAWPYPKTQGTMKQQMVVHRCSEATNGCAEMWSTPYMIQHANLPPEKILTSTWWGRNESCVFKNASRPKKAPSKRKPCHPVQSWSGAQTMRGSQNARAFIGLHVLQHWVGAGGCRAPVSSQQH